MRQVQAGFGQRVAEEEGAAVTSMDAIASLGPALQELLQAQIAFNDAMAALSASLPDDMKRLADRMCAAGWSRSEAWDYAWSVPEGTHWLYPTPHPPTSPS
jgi:hypothetical protein